MNILVTGGTGYIGSHTVVELLNQGYDVDIIDNLYNSKIDVLQKINQITGKIPNFFQIDLLDEPKLEQIFQQKQYDLVIHFAGFKAVAESVKDPLKYYENNLLSTINLLKCMRQNHVQKIIFSSSATVYGDHNQSPLNEEMQTGIGITNPYGRTKFMIEEMLKDVAASDPDFSATILRYFNPIGNHKSGIIGEDPNGIPNNLMPIIMKVARGEFSALNIYGDDYPTKDGTCVRDYIHVVDLAKGHIAAAMKMTPGVSIYNLGTGNGTSVLEMIAAFEQASGKSLPHQIAPRRDGDLPELLADPSKAERGLDWHAELSIADAMRDTLAFLSRSAA